MYLHVFYIQYYVPSTGLSALQLNRVVSIISIHIFYIRKLKHGEIRSCVQYCSDKLVVRLRFDCGSLIVLFTMTPASERCWEDPSPCRPNNGLRKDIVFNSDH